MFPSFLQSFWYFLFLGNLKSYETNFMKSVVMESTASSNAGGVFLSMLFGKGFVMHVDFPFEYHSYS